MTIDIDKLSSEQLSALVAKVQRRQAELAIGRVAETRSRIQALLDAEGLTLTEVFDGRSLRVRGKPGRQAKEVVAVKQKAKTKKVAKVKKKTSNPKYRNPKDASQTWVGRGKRPAWFSAALKAGKSEQDLLV